jgi:hypothetical protein
VAQTHAAGWHHCNIRIRNRLDSDIKFTRVVVVSPQGFLLAKRSEQHVQRADELTATGALDPQWICAAAPYKGIDRELFVKPKHKPRGARTLKFEFSFLILDADRRERTATVKTNSIEWNANG